MKVKDRKIKVLKSDAFGITEYGISKCVGVTRILGHIAKYYSMWKAYLFIDNGVCESECFEKFENAENWILEQDLSKFKGIPQ